MASLQDRVVVITGASSGIGRAASLMCAGAGASVVAVARDEDALRSLVVDHRAARRDGRHDGHGEIVARPADVTDHAALDAIAAETVERRGRIDVWVNNAAVNLYGPLEEVPVEMWHRVVEVDVFGTYHGIRAVLPWMRERGRGTIINVSSVLGKIPAPAQSAYVASKFAVRALSDCVRQEVADVPGIDVCTVLPGPIDTPLFQHAGNFSGRRIKPIAPTIDAWRVADAITACAARPRREVAVGVSSSLNLAAARLAPATVARVAGRLVRRDHFQSAPEQASVGNLWEPDRRGVEVNGGTSGGWDRAGRPVGPGRAVTQDRSWHPPPEQLDRRSVDGQELVARSWGGPEVTGRTPVVMVHGLGIASRMCRPAGQRLAAHRPVHAVDLPGFGLSATPPGTPGIVELADALAGWIRAAVDGPVVLVGVSLGTQVAAEAAARHGELCAGVVLVSPIVEPGRRTWPRQLARWPLEQATQSIKMRLLMVADYAAAGPARVARTFARALHHRVEDTVPRITCPVLVCRGTRDPLVSREWAQQVADRTTDGRLVELERAVHAMTHEDPVDLAAAVEDFVATTVERAEHAVGGRA